MWTSKAHITAVWCTKKRTFLFNVDRCHLGRSEQPNKIHWFRRILFVASSLDHSLYLYVDLLCMTCSLLRAKFWKCSWCFPRNPTRTKPRPGNVPSERSRLLWIRNSSNPIWKTRVTGCTRTPPLYLVPFSELEATQFPAHIQPTKTSQFAISSSPRTDETWEDWKTRVVRRKTELEPRCLAGEYF